MTSILVSNDDGIKAPGLQVTGFTPPDRELLLAPKSEETVRGEVVEEGIAGSNGHAS